MMSPSLTYLIHGATLTLAWFFVVNVLVSAVVALMARWLLARLPATSAGTWLWLRLAPSVSATAFVGAVFLPSYWKYEPRDVAEGFDVMVLVCAAAALAAGTAGLVRGASAWHRASRRARGWMRSARPLALPGTDIPGFEVEAEAPLMALVGVVQPRLLVTRGLIAALTPEELAASVAHEVGHSRGRDNFKRLAMRAAPDVFAATCGVRMIDSAFHALEQRWAAASEHRADRLASEHDATLRCALASALVKVARLTPALPRPTAEPISTLVGGGEIASRVRRLLDDRNAPPAARSSTARLLAAGVSLAAAAVLYAPLLHRVHDLTEFLVRSLP